MQSLVCYLLGSQRCGIVHITGVLLWLDTGSLGRTAKSESFLLCGKAVGMQKALTEVA